MRLLLALTALAALAAANRRSDDVSYKKIEPYGPGKEYVYIYDGQIASGIPGASEQHSVQRMQAKVHLVFTTEQTAVIKLRDVRVVAEQRDLAEPREVLPMRAFHSSSSIDEESTSSGRSSSIDQEKLNKLEKPVAFKYDQGLVSQLQFDPEDPTWSTNVKRAIINLLQVNVKQHGRTDLEEENKLHNSVRDPKDFSNDYFTAYEKTLEGNCETMYTITAMPPTIGSYSSGEVLNVTKSINFEKCKRRPQIKYNMRFAEKCGQSCENEFTDDEQTVKSSTVIKMNISGTIERFAIERAMVHSEYVFAPLADHSNVLITHVKAHLRLEKFGKTETRLTEPTGREKEELIYSPKWDQMKERFVMDGDDEFTRRSPYTEITNKVEAIEGILRRMLRAVNDPKKGVDHEATRQIARLVKMLRLCSEHDMQKVHNELFDGSKFEENDKQKVREILVDALALAGTKTTIEHLVKKIKAKEVTPARAAHSLKALVNIRVPSEKQIDTLLELCKDSSVVEKSGVLKQSCLLTSGSMINALCKDNEDKLAVQDEDDEGRYTQEKICSRQTKQKYVEKLWSFFEKAETRYERVLALKALANAGLDVSIFKLEDLIRDFNEDKLVRAEAIDALRQLRSVMPKKIQKVLMPVFANRRELPSLRMLAFAQIMQTQPIERALLDQLAQFIYRERSQHVHAFVHSMMSTMANSTIPCEKQTAEDLQTSLRMARAPSPSPSAMRSLYWHMPMFSTEQKMGGTIRLGALLTNTSYLPVELMAGLDTVFMGDWVKNTLQVGLVQRDIESVVERSLRSLYQRGLDELIVRGKRSSGFRPAEMLRDLFTKLGIQSRRGEGEQYKPYAMLYVRYKDMDYAVLPFDESTMPETIKQIYNEGKLDISAIERFLAHGHQLNTHGASFVYETMKKFPTSMGIPLQVSNKMPLVASLKSHITAEVEPNNGRNIRGLRAKIIAQGSVAATHVSKMELWWPLVNSGVKLVASAQINLPIHVEAQISSERAEALRVIIQTPEQEKRLLSLHTRPSTFMRVWPKQARAYVDVQEKTIHHEQQNRISSVEGVYGKELLGGAELEVHCQWHRTPSQPMKGMPNSLLAGENIVEVFTKPHSDSKEIVLTVTGELFARPDGSVHKPEHGKFYDSEEDDSRSYERMDSSEYGNEETYKKSKKLRRDNFEKYTKEYSTDKSYKHRLHMAMETSGKQRKAEVVLQAVCDPQMRFCKLEAKAIRPAMLSGESRPWTLKAKGQTLYPELVSSLESLKEQQHREFNAELEAEWGSDQKYIVKMRAQGEQSRRAKKLLDDMTNKQRGEYDEEYAKYDKYELLEKAAYLDQYKLEVEYDTPISASVANYTYKLYNLLKAYQWQNSDIKLIGDYNKDVSQRRRLSAVWNIDPQSYQYLNLSITSPLERVNFIDIALPVPFKPLVNIRRGSPAIHSFSQLLKRGKTGMSSGTCSVDGKRVETFDDVEYKAKMTNCFVLLAKDCTDKEQPSFAVMMKKTEKSGEEKTIKIVTEQKEIEIEMKSGEQKMKVKVNGEHIREESRLRDEFGIDKVEDGYKVEIEEAGIRVFFDGYSTQIKTSDTYLASQCGLCGNYNGDRDDEWRMPSNSLTNDYDEFRRSYDTEECKEYSKKGSYSKYNDEEESETEQRSDKHRRGGSSSSSNDEEEPIKVTAVVEQDGELCFSKQPIHICRDSSSIKESKKQTVSFVCEPRSRSSIEKQREARRRVVEVSGSPSFSDSVRVAVKCESSDYDSYGRDTYEY